MSGEGEAVDWPGVTKQLASRFTGRELHPDVARTLRRSRRRRVLVACSGGADSVFMLCMLYALAESNGLLLFVAHYNHRWREVASDRDAAFVKGLARGLNLEYVEGARPRNEAAFTETTARALRLAFLRRVAADKNCGLIAFGHQLDDILETQLMRLARGSGSDGLAAPRPVSVFAGLPKHLRPVLHLRSGEIKMCLNSIGIPWCEDASNEDMLIARNALRHKVIPDLSEAVGRDAGLGAFRSRLLLEEDACALEALAREKVPAAFAGVLELDRLLLKANPRALTRRAMLAWLNAHGIIDSFSASSMDLLIDAIYSGREQNRFSAGLFYIVLSQEHVRFESIRSKQGTQIIEPTIMEPGQSVILSNGTLIESQLVELSAGKLEMILKGEVEVANEAYIERSKYTLMNVRGWMPGDRFKPIGAPGSKKLKDWFIDRHIPRKERKRLPIVTNAVNEIIWVPGFPPADALKLSPKSKLALRLTYESRNPT